MVTVGVLVRALDEQLGSIEGRLAQLACVSTTIRLEEPGSLGLVLQGGSLDEVHASLTQDVLGTEGVLAAWPLHTELGQVPAGDRSEIPNTPENHPHRS